MHTRQSGRTSPLFFKPEIERLVRANKAAKRQQPPSPHQQSEHHLSLNMENDPNPLLGPQFPAHIPPQFQQPVPPPIPPHEGPAVAPNARPHDEHAVPDNVHQRPPTNPTASVHSSGRTHGSHLSNHNNLHLHNMGNGDGDHYTNVESYDYEDYMSDPWDENMYLGIPPHNINHGNPNYPLHNEIPRENQFRRYRGYREPRRGAYHNPHGYEAHIQAPMQGVDSHFRPTVHQNPSPIVMPHRNGRQFEIRPNTISILPIFRGVASDEPYYHLEEFEAICSTVGGQGFTNDEIKLILFRFSLQDRAKKWFRLLPAHSIHTWAQMQQAFLDEYFSIGKTSDARKAIKSFTQTPGEAFHEAFQRFNEMLRMCPHHDIPKWDLVKIFYDGLLPDEAKMVFSSSGVLF